MDLDAFSLNFQMVVKTQRVSFPQKIIKQGMTRYTNIYTPSWCLSVRGFQTSTAVTESRSMQNIQQNITNPSGPIEGRHSQLDLQMALSHILLWVPNRHT
jgi:hypothetical protein